MAVTVVVVVIIGARLLVAVVAVTTVTLVLIGARLGSFGRARRVRGHRSVRGSGRARGARMLDIIVVSASRSPSVITALATLAASAVIITAALITVEIPVIMLVLMMSMMSMMHWLIMAVVILIIAGKPPPVTVTGHKTDQEKHC